MSAENLYNAGVSTVRENARARVIRVVPDGAKKVYLPGQYGSLGLASDADGAKLVKRAYSLSSPILNLATGELDDPAETAHYEFYFNRIDADSRGREGLTPKLFTLREGDRLFCGPKITGHYTIDRLPRGKNVLLVASTTGEAPNNSIAAALLSQDRGIRIASVLVGDADWSSLYDAEHSAAAERFDCYRRLSLFQDGAFAALNGKLAAWCSDASKAEAELGFKLSPETAHVFLVGDPGMIGQPEKLGAWKYTHAAEGAVPTLLEHGFSIMTKFKEGEIDYESYW